MIIRNGLVLQFEHEGFIKKDLLIKNGLIEKIENFIEVGPESDEVIDATGKFITPGLIEAHTHLGISEEGMGNIGDDCNDYSDVINAHLEVVDAIYPYDAAIKEAVAHGITTACVCPGSDSVIGGVISTIKLTGKVVDDMIITRKTALKCSLGENPKTAKLGFSSRMGTAYHLRKSLSDAQHYKNKKEQAALSGEYFKSDMGMENLVMVLNREIPFHVHAHRSDDICTAIRIAKEFEIDLVLVHCTDGRAIKEYLGKNNYPAIVGPINVRSKVETWGKHYSTLGILHEAGVKVCATTDHDVTPQYLLPVCAALSVRYGLPEIEALKSITINPAEVLNISERKGNLKVGLDADLVIWSQHPFHFDTQVEKVWIEGKCVYENNCEK